MPKTTVSIIGEDFYINGKKTYSESPKPGVQGLLMNARFIQGIFDAQNCRERFDRFGKIFDPDRNTGDLIAQLPSWYRYGLRAFTVGLQGGGAIFAFDDCAEYVNNPFSVDGLRLDAQYAKRLDRLIRAADEIGMAVIVNFFYISQNQRIKGAAGIINALKTGLDFLTEGGYANVLVDIANEHDISACAHDIIRTEEGMAALIGIAREHCGGRFPISCSFCGGVVKEQVARAADFVLIHGNGLTRQGYYNLTRRARELAPGKPIVCNEDSQAIGNMAASVREHVSWGYYNNATKQEPPADWSPREGEDLFFANRMAMELGLPHDDIPSGGQIFLQGLKADETDRDKRWIRLASLFPEKIDYVDFYLDGKLSYTCYDEPFLFRYATSWIMSPLLDNEWREEIKAVAHMRDGGAREFVGKKIH
ncbi:MAG: hypothetical protein FWF44_04815 [Defluviitaleaceae bacterium]|nr:hypothetical protein [Defluviitaleaceae bacterium]